MAQSFASPATTDSGPTSIPKKAISFDLTAIDKTADPCTDFYQYACGNWNKDNPIPSDRVRWGRFDELGERNNYLLYEELKAAADAPKTPLQTKYGDFFASCMNTEEADKLGAKPLAPMLAAIDGLKSGKDFAALNVQLENSFGAEELVGVGTEQDQKDSSKQILATGQGGLSLPDRDYYLNDDDRSKTIRAQYVAHVTKMFTLLGDTPEQAAVEAASVMRIETALAKGSMSRVDRRDPAKTLPRDDHRRGAAVDPDLRLEDLPGRHRHGRGAQHQHQLAGISAGGERGAHQRAAAGPEELPALARSCTARRRTSPSRSTTRTSTSSAATLQGQKEQQPRWKRCTALTDRALGEAVGQDWVKTVLPARSQGQHGEAGPCARSGARAGHPAAAMDEPCHQGGGREEAGCHPRQDRLPRRTGATTRSSRSSAMTCSATWSAMPSSSQPQPRQVRQAGGRDRVGHDAAHRERLLQPGA